MAEGVKFYTALGTVQKFKDKPVVEERETSNGMVMGFKIQTAQQGQVSVSLWPENQGCVHKLNEGAFVAVRGKYTESTGNNGTKYHNISAHTIAIVPAEPRTERELVNQVNAGQAGADTFQPPTF